MAVHKIRYQVQSRHVHGRLYLPVSARLHLCDSACQHENTTESEIKKSEENSTSYETTKEEQGDISQKKIAPTQTNCVHLI